MGLSRIGKNAFNQNRKRSVGPVVNANTGRPVVQCPKCSKVMLDVRAEKTNPKAPDFQCPDANCLNDKGYRTGAWLPKGQRASPAQPPPPPSAPVAPQAQPGPSPRDTLILELFWDSFDRVLAGVAQRKLSDLFKPENICALVATMYIQRAKG